MASKGGGNSTPRPLADGASVGPRAEGVKFRRRAKLKTSKQQISSARSDHQATTSEPRATRRIVEFRCALALLSLALYHNALNCGFVYDDRRAILENADVVGSHEAGSWLRLFGNDFWGTPIGNAGSHKSYRPLVTLTYKLQAYLQGQFGKLFTLDNAQEQFALPYHLVNVLLHVYVVDQVFQVASLLSIVICKAQDPYYAPKGWILDPLAMTSSVLFACHHVHVEAVTSLVGRAELMGAMFALLSFKSLLAQHVAKLTKRRLPFCGESKFAFEKTILFAALACFCKENYATVIPINLWLIVWMRLRSHSESFNFKAAGCLVGLLVGFVSFRAKLNTLAGGSILPSFSASDNPLAQSARQFCLRNPNELEQELAVVSNSTISSLESKMEIVCSNPKILAKIDAWLVATRFKLPGFALFLLISNEFQSYDWPLSSIRLVKDPLSFEFVVWVAICCLAGWTLLCWLGKLCRPSLNLAAKIQDDSRCSQVLAKSSSFHDSQGSHEETDSSGQEKDFKALPECGRRERAKWTKELTILDRQLQYEETKLDQIGWSLVWLIIPYLPSSNLIFPVGFLVAERTLYLPSFGFCLLVCNLVNCWLFQLSKLKLPKRYNLAKLKLDGFDDILLKWLLLSTLFVNGAIRTVGRNHDWRNEVALFSKDVRFSPAKSMANLASALNSTSDLGGQDGAEKLYRAALSMEPNSPENHYNL